MKSLFLIFIIKVQFLYIQKVAFSFLYSSFSKIVTAINFNLQIFNLHPNF